MTQNQNPLPLDKEYEAKPETKGLKIKNTRSLFTKAAAEKAEFEQRADQYMNERQDRNARAVDLAKQFISFLRDKTLTDNKSIIVKDVENGIKNKLIELAVEVNNDENEPNEGMGSIAVLTILLKTCLMQRDTINELDHKLSQIEKRLGRLEKQQSSIVIENTSNVKEG